MKFPTHIILDFKNSSALSTYIYWLKNYSNQFKIENTVLTNLLLQKLYLFTKKNILLNKFLLNKKLFTTTISYSNFSKIIFFSKKKIIKKKLFFKDIIKLDTNLGLLLNINTKQINLNLSNKTNKFWNLFDIIFLKKERMYTKLKYSRTPQYDIVSGGSAALFAGFLGFLICEKFGFELIDSGDFYFLFMYIVFIFFFGRIFFKIMTQIKSSWSIISIKWILLFYQNLFLLVIKFLKNLNVFFNK